MVGGFKLIESSDGVVGFLEVEVKFLGRQRDGS